MTYRGRRGERERKARRDKKLFLCLTAASIGLAFVGIVWASIAGLFALWFLSSWIADFDRFSETTNRKLWILRISILVCGCAIASWPVHRQWRIEQAEKLEGELCSYRSFWGTCYSPASPIIEIADSGTKFIWAGSGRPMQMGGFAHNVGLRIEQGKHGIELSTPLLDRSGKKIVEIDKNHWTVAPWPEIWDKNYSQNSLEVLDNREQVVLQIKFLPDRIQIAAEWRDQFGRGQEWSKCASNKAFPACISPWGSPQTELQNEQVIEPIFKYPSKDFLGEFVK